MPAKQASSATTWPNLLSISQSCRIIFLGLSIDRMGAIFIEEFR